MDSLEHGEHDPETWVVPPGTQVVAVVAVRAGGETIPAGATGVVVKAPVDPTHAYRVRFVDGREASLSRDELAVRKEVQRQALGPTDSRLVDRGLERFVIYRCVIGSRAYGLEGEGSDTDRRGVYLPPAALHWSLRGVPEQLEDPVTRDCYWELQKFLVLALKANPNVLECLWTPLVEHAAPVAQELLALRRAFLSKLVYVTFNGYVISQFRKLEQDLRARGAPRWKHAMHLIRLLLAGEALLRTGELPVRVGEHRERLLAIKRGEVAWAELEAWRHALHAAFDRAHATTSLPERPDYARVDAFLVAARRRMIDVAADVPGDGPGDSAPGGGASEGAGGAA
jgi:predicted nucleotidyltransferase